MILDSKQIPEPDLALEPVQYPIRMLRAGSWETFVKRYEPIEWGPDNELLMDPRQLPKWVAKGEGQIFYRYIWTVLDVDGVLYVAPGMRFVDRMGYIITTKPYHDDETVGMEYRY